MDLINCTLSTGKVRMILFSSWNILLYMYWLFNVLLLLITTVCRTGKNIFNYQLAFYLWSVNIAKGIAMMYYSFTWWWLTFKLVDSSKLYCVIKKCQVCSPFLFLFLLFFNKWSPWSIKCPEIEYTSSSNLNHWRLIVYHVGCWQEVLFFDNSDDISSSDAHEKDKISTSETKF